MAKDNPGRHLLVLQAATESSVCQRVKPEKYLLHSSKQDAVLVPRSEKCERKIQYFSRRSSLRSDRHEPAGDGEPQFAAVRGPQRRAHVVISLPGTACDSIEPRSRTNNDGRESGPRS